MGLMAVWARELPLFFHWSGPTIEAEAVNTAESRMSLEELVAEVKILSLEDRAALAKRIVRSLDDLSESEVEALWVQEAQRRLEEMEQGRAVEIPAEEVLRRARAAIS